MHDTLEFIRALITSPARTGAVAPSSAVLAREMVRDLALRGDDGVLEFGPGTGPFTRALRILMPERSNYLGIERNAAFVKLLQQRYPDMQVVEGSAEQAPTLARQAGVPPVKAIICGLPFASLPPRAQDGVIAALDQVMTPGCTFRTFQYVHAYALPTAIRFRRRIAALLGPAHVSRAVWRNCPPAFVLSWTRREGERPRATPPRL